MDFLRNLLSSAPSPLFQTYLTRIFTRWLYLKTSQTLTERETRAHSKNRSFLTLPHPDLTESPHGLKYPKTRTISPATSSINHSLRDL